MRVKRILIETELDEVEQGASPRPATLMTFENGLWTANGALYNRIATALGEIVRLLRGNR